MARLPLDRRAAEDAGFWAKKGLGQHLLRDPKVAQEALNALAVAEGEGILEIGPGLGALTDGLLATGATVLAIEVDTAACDALRKRYALEPRFKLIEADVLKCDLVTVARETFGQARFHVAANLPYYITTPVLAKVFEEGLPFTRMAALTQWEVGQRLGAKPGGKDYAALSVLAQFHCVVTLLRKVLPGAFTPPPKVNSALLLFERRLKPAQVLRDQKLFFKVVRSAFGKRRKTLRNALSMPGGLQADPAELETAFSAASIDPARRAETLSLEDFAALANALAQGRAVPR